MCISLPSWGCFTKRYKVELHIFFERDPILTKADGSTELANIEDSDHSVIIQLTNHLTWFSKQNILNFLPLIVVIFYIRRFGWMLEHRYFSPMPSAWDAWQPLGVTTTTIIIATGRILSLSLSRLSNSEGFPQGFTILSEFVCPKTAHNLKKSKMKTKKP